MSNATIYDNSIIAHDARIKQPHHLPEFPSLRITFILPPDGLFGGIRVLAIYAQRLAQRGHTVTVIQPRHAKPSLRESLRSMRRGEGWPKDKNTGVSYFDTLKHPNLTRTVLNHPAPITAADVPDADIVLASWWETAEWVWSLPKSKGAKAHFMQDYEIWGGNLERVDATCRLPMPKIIIAKWVEKLLQEKFNQTPAALIGNSVDTDLFQAPRRTKQPIATVGFTYTPMRNKGTDIAIAAIAQARLELPNLQVKAFGSMQVAKELPLPPETDFSFRAPDKKLPLIYASCDAWLFGTRIEGFGLPILEAMACRTPVIGTPAGAAPELLTKAGGILVAPEDPNAMAAAIVNIAKMSDDQWRHLSDLAHTTARSYTWDNATDQMETVLQALSHN